MITMKFEGGAELAAALNNLSARLSKSIMRGALVEGAEPIRKSGAANMARGSEAPHIAENVVISNARTDDMVAVAVGPAKGFAYGLPQEVGTIHMPAHPAMRPSFDSQKERSLKIIGDAAWRELAGRGVSRPMQTSDDEVGDLGLTRKQALPQNVFKGKQRSRKPRAKK